MSERTRSVEEALSLVLGETCVGPDEISDLDRALGLVLTESIAADADSPPFDKALVDGYAVQSADLSSGSNGLQVVEQVVAGQVPRMSVERGTAIRVMTGAPLPRGADAMVMIEQTAADPAHADRVVFQGKRVESGQNIMRQGHSYRCGVELLSMGKRLSPADLGLLAEVGRAQVRVKPRPRVAVLSTGNELVPPELRPQPGQIRNSNGPMLRAQVAVAGGVPVNLGIARDEQSDLSTLISAGLADDFLLLSGGVSAGLLDLVPQVLATLGVQQIFHKVEMKPGKPLWFGVLRRPQDPISRATYVFGLPGNPVSSLVCFELFVRPALEKWMGRPPGNREFGATMESRYVYRGVRPTYFPASLVESSTGESSAPRVQLLDWRGSADLRTLMDADCLVKFPAGDATYEAGAPVTALRLDRYSA